ncbi:Fis family transcriptional regulator [Paenibacillus darwinianus]|uniref:Fis family transcriptional regulator n=1 Tax=Paenibacillus darwinianus TaxID=1380763 RepID=A0A9W5W7L1_9BACL|nr:response regulator [Paenibacillus darwinianus]EXX87786.1 Fis family transcriptional regulator [Paenibacillus darwinianus]EXX88160.1 Fis family transcriptional regulator [Paenibacillus darwinianus]EXX89039.1 Fis family transcriptional regulator [Paenibacillus darwinianus]
MKNSIVVVDDDPIIRMDLREMLEEEGYHIGGEAKNGQEAIELVAKLKPDLVIMDIKMPVMNGIKASHIIRKMQDTSVLLLTAYSQKELVQDARSAGVAAYLVKPVSEADLIPAVEIALSQKERMDALKHDLQQLKQSIEERKRIEKAKGIVMKAYALEEEEAYRKMRMASMAFRMPLSRLAACILQDGPGQLASMSLPDNG